MDFLRLNKWKVFAKICLYIVISGIIFLFGNLSIRAKLTETALDKMDEIRIWFNVIYGFALFVFILYYFTNVYNFYRSRRLLRDIIYPQMFDGNKYVHTHIYKNLWLIYTKEGVYGNISGYPTIARVDIAMAKHSDTIVELNFFVIKLSKTTTQTLSLKLADASTGNMKTRIDHLIKDFQIKGLEPGHVCSEKEASDMIGLTTN